MTAIDKWKELTDKVDYIFEGKTMRNIDCLFEHVAKPYCSVEHRTNVGNEYEIDDLFFSFVYTNQTIQIDDDCDYKTWVNDYVFSLEYKSSVTHIKFSTYVDSWDGDDIPDLKQPKVVTPVIKTITVYEES